MYYKFSLAPLSASRSILVSMFQRGVLGWHRAPNAPRARWSRARAPWCCMRSSCGGGVNEHHAGGSGCSHGRRTIWREEGCRNSRNLRLSTGIVQMTAKSSHLKEQFAALQKALTLLAASHADLEQIRRRSTRLMFQTIAAFTRCFQRRSGAPRAVRLVKKLAHTQLS